MGKVARLVVNEISIGYLVDNLVGLDEEHYVGALEDIIEEVRVDGYQELLPLVVFAGVPDANELSFDKGEIALGLKQLLDHEVGERTVLHTVTIGEEVHFDLILQLAQRDDPVGSEQMRLLILNKKGAVVTTFRCVLT